MNAQNELRSLAMALQQPLDEVDSMTPEQIRVHLSEQGYDIGRINELFSDRLKQIEGKTRLARAATLRKNVANQVSRVGQHLEHVGSKRDEVLRRLQAMQAEQPRLAAAMFRKFEAADEADFESLYQDLLRLDVMDDDEAQEK